MFYFHFGKSFITYCRVGSTWFKWPQLYMTNKFKTTTYACQSSWLRQGPTCTCSIWTAFPCPSCRGNGNQRGSSDLKYGLPGLPWSNTADPRPNSWKTQGYLCPPSLLLRLVFSFSHPPSMSWAAMIFPCRNHYMIFSEGVVAVQCDFSTD